MKIANKISILIFLTVLTIAGVVGPLVYSTCRRDMEQVAFAHLTSTARAKASHIEDFLNMQEGKAVQLSRGVTLQKFLNTDPAAPDYGGVLDPVRKRLIMTTEDNESILEIFVLDTEGRAVASTDNSRIGQDKSRSPSFLNAQSGPYIEDAYLSETTGRSMLTVSAPVVDRETQRFLGVVVAGVGLDWLGRITLAETDLAEAVEVYLLNREGYMITPSRFLGDTFLKLKVDMKTGGGSSGDAGPGPGGYRYAAFRYKNYSGVDVLGVHLDMPVMGWTLVAEIDRDEAFAPLIRIKRIFFIITLAILVILSFLGMIASKLITVPIRKLHKGAEIIGQGDLDYKVGTDSRDEIGELSRAFDTMTEHLKRSTASIDSLNREIEERRQAEEVLRESEEKYYSLISSMEDYMYLMDRDCRYLFMNRGYRERYGLEPEEITEKAYRDFHTEEETEVFAQEVAKVFETGRSLQTEVTSTESNRYFIKTLSPVRDKDGGVRAVTVVSKDITERRQAEEGLRESEERYRTIIEDIEDGYFEMDLAGRFTFFNDALCRIHGYPRDELMGMHYKVYMHEDDIEGVRRSFNRVYTTGEPSRGTTWRTTMKDGAKKFLETSASPIRDSEGRPVGFRGIVRDITERKRMEETLRESEERYRNILETIEDGYFEIDLSGNYTFVNDVICRHLRYSREELIGMNNRQYQDEETAKKTYRFFAEVYETGKPVRAFEMEVIRKDGTRQISEVSISLIRDAGGNPVGFRGTSRDISDRKRMEETLRESEERYRTIIESVQDGYWEIDLEGKFTFVNDAMCRISEAPREDLMGVNVADYADPATAERIYKVFEQVYLTGVPSKAEDYEIGRVSGGRGVFQFNASLIRDAGGNPVGFRGITRDITERKRMEETLRESEEKYRTILENIEDGYFETTLAGRLTFFNDALCRIHGYSREELLSMGYKDYTHKDDIEKVFKAYNRIYTTGEPDRELAWKAIRRDGREGFLEASVSLIRDQEGRPIGFRGIVRDVSERKEAEEKLRRAHEEAEAANVAKSQFLASMSHEIRTPMNAIIGVTELLAGTSLYDEQKEYVDMVQISANSLLGIINDILDLSKIEAGGLDFEETQFDIREVIETTGITLATRAHKKGTELLCHISQDVPMCITGDPLRIRQILLNLAGNAIKFTEEGEIVIKVRVEERKKDRVILHFCVSDTGIGIPKEKQEKIFESFTQADGSTTRKYGGTGLGLTISKQLIERMGGEIWVESKEGEGSTFHFTLPTRAIEKPEKEEVLIPLEVKQLSALIVDDSRINRLILRELLTAWGGVPAEAKDGTSGLKALKEAEERGAPYQFIILDKNMPDIDGFKTARKIKKLEGYANVPIILLTSSEEKGDRKKADAIGISKVLLKPVRSSNLYDAIVAALAGTKREKVVPREEKIESEFKGRPLQILLAEDNPINQKLATRLLEKQGWKVTIANSGREAVDLSGENAFDFILMDIQMPEMDGLEAAREIREREKVSGGRVPIIALTAHAFEEDRKQALVAGMDGYATKPIRVRTLFGIIEEVLDKNAGS